jgi:integrase/recombinase XerD
VTHLRKMMLEELQRRNYSQKTTKAYLHTVWEFAKYFHRSPDQLGPEHIREFQAHLFSVRKLSGNSVAQRTAALRFLFVKTLKRSDMLEHIPFPKVPLRLPTVLSPEEVTQLIDAAPNLLYRTILMTLYSTGMRRAELVQLKAADIDKQLMLVHIREGKGTSTWYLRCPMNCPRSPCRTRKRSTVCCSRPARTLCWRSPPIPNISAPPSDSSAFYTPGGRTSC